MSASSSPTPLPGHAPAVVSPTRTALSPIDRLIVAFDVESPAEALAWGERLKGNLRWVKIGSKLFTAGGPALLAGLQAQGYSVFLDLKFHDIPEVVAGAVREAVRQQVSIITLHAAGGKRMMAAAVEAARSEALRLGTAPPLLLGVTVLTSLGSTDLEDLGWGTDPGVVVDRLARLAADSGMSGVVCSPLEIARVKAAHPSRVVLTPGVRPAGPEFSTRADDQVRVATPSEALRAGADYLVVGRPILQAPDPLRALLAVLKELSSC